jgi:hypothetical protein
MKTADDFLRKVIGCIVHQAVHQAVYLPGKFLAEVYDPLPDRSSCNLVTRDG